jgi:uncharacterized protein
MSNTLNATVPDTAVPASTHHGPPWRVGLRSGARTGRWARLLAGLWLFGVGISLMVEAHLGVSPWDVLHDALRLTLPLSFGGAVILVSVALVLISFGLGVKPGPGTVANMILVGVFTDTILWTGLLDGLASSHLSIRLPALLTGVAALAFGTALYISAGLGAGPRDSLMLAVARHIGTTPGTARGLIEASVLAIGALMGGRFGIGTAIFTVTIGGAINISFRLFGMEPRTRRKRDSVTSATRAVRLWIRRGRLGDTSSRKRSRYTRGRRIEQES